MLAVGQSWTRSPVPLTKKLQKAGQDLAARNKTWDGTIRLGFFGRNYGNRERRKLIVCPVQPKTLLKLDLKPAGFLFSGSVLAKQPSHLYLASLSRETACGMRWQMEIILSILAKYRMIIGIRSPVAELQDEVAVCWTHCWVPGITGVKAKPRGRVMLDGQRTFLRPSTKGTS